MKPLLVLALVLCSAICAGCTAPAATAPAIPNLTGNWTGSPQGYIEGTGYIAGNGTLFLQVTGQQGRVFNGSLSIVEANGSILTRRIAGAISRDGKGFALVQSDTGYDLGTIVSDREIEFVYISDRDPAKVVIDSFAKDAA